MTDKWVRVMADYCSDGVWERDGVMMGRTDLPISAALAERHSAWCDWYETYPIDSQNKSKFDIEGFSAEGLAIAQLIKAELPDWTVIYHDEGKAKYSDDEEEMRQFREEFEYEIKL